MSTGDIRWGILQQKVQETNISRAFDLFREQGIEPILIKGFAAALCYPPTFPRLSIDIDLAVPRSDFQTALKIASSATAEGLAIDLHRDLRYHDTVAWDDLFENSRLIELGGGSCRVLRSEDHLRVLCVHWLLDGGSNRDRLWDIYYAVANRGPGFDWDRFLNVVSHKRRRWLICTLGLAHRYLGLDLDDTPVKTEAQCLPEWLTKTVESEWTNEIKNTPLEVAMFDRKALINQLHKKLWPNPIWATIQMEGSFDAESRFFYQLGNIFQRIPSSIKRITTTLLSR